MTLSEAIDHNAEYYVTGRYLAAARRICLRLFTEDRLNGDEMRCLAHTLELLIEDAREID